MHGVACAYLIDAESRVLHVVTSVKDLAGGRHDSEGELAGLKDVLMIVLQRKAILCIRGSEADAGEGRSGERVTNE